MHRFRPYVCRALALAFVVGFAPACQDVGNEGPSQAGAAIATQTAPIVNGSTETGYPAVGALTFKSGFQYGGSFCTATLIAPSWVITAAHCLVDANASETAFYVGNDARPLQNGAAPSNGAFYPAERFVVHPQYDADRLENDIALVKLSSNVSGVNPYSFNESNLGPYRGQSALYVGFGVDDGLTERGGGLKRSTSMAISAIYTQSFLTAYAGSGTCFGDSGGPAFLTIGGATKVVGLTSAGAGCSGFNCDPCKTDSINTRTDAFGAWIRQQMGAPPPDCRQDTSICACASACGTTGSCNNAVCQVGSCSETYDCLVGCADGACQQACLATASPEGLSAVQALLTCFETNCATQTGQAFQTCAGQFCGPQVDLCFDAGPTATGTQSCDDIYTCMGDCGSDNQCLSTCYAKGTADAQTQLSAMADCFDSKCGNTSGQAFQDCAVAQCGDAIDTCLGGGDGTPCNLVGGDCGGGETCWPTTSGSTACFPSTGRGLGQACNPEAATLECLDGAACVGADTTGICEAFCRSDADCAGATCDVSATGINGLGLCQEGPATCVDADADGYCAVDDCNDQAAGVNPGAAEVCGDSQDNNCSGQADEGCPGGPTPTQPGDGGVTGTQPGTGCGSGGTPVLFSLLAGLFLVGARRRRLAR